MAAHRLIGAWAIAATLLLAWLVIDRANLVPAPGDPAARDAIQLDAPPIVIWAYGAEAQRLSWIFAEFQRAWPRQELRLVAKSWGEFPGPELLALPPGERPDLIQIGSTWVAALADAGLLMPLDDRLRAGFIRPEIMTGQSWSLYRTETGQVAVPWYLDVRALYHRTDIVPTPPATWRELRALAPRLRLGEDGRKERFALSLNPDAHNFLMIYWALGGTLEPLDGTTLTAALDHLLALYRDEVAPFGRYEETRDPEAILALGYTPMMISGPWHLRPLETEFPAARDSWTTAPLPRAAAGVSFLGGAGWAIPVGARNPDGAWSFIEFMTHEKRQSRWWEIAGVLPANRQAWASGDLAAPRFAGFRAALDTARHPPVDARWAATEIAWSRTLRQAVDGRIGRDQARAELLAAANWLAAAP